MCVYLKNSISQKPETQHTNLMPLNPAAVANCMNSRWVRSLPPGFWVIIKRSALKAILAAVVPSGITGRIASTTITFPSLGIALWQIFNSFKQCSSLQSRRIHWKIWCRKAMMSIKSYNIALIYRLAVCIKIHTTWFP